jgi:uncharacterized protein YdhG (YjbR/CyaY superfamily)
MKKDEPAEIDRYIAGFPPDVVFILERLRETIHKAAPGATEGFDYDMPVFRYDGRHIMFVGAWKKHVGLYPIYPQAPELEAELAPLRSGKDTVKLVYARPIPYALVTKLVKARVKELKANAKAR